jgi:phage major head subunit gpT-like protein
LRNVTQTMVEALRVGFSKRFGEGLQKAAPLHTRFATPVTSSTKTETYGWLGNLPAFRKWVGEKRIKVIEELAYTLVNDPYEATGQIHKHQIADDNLGIWPASMEKWGAEGAYWPDRLCFDALARGHQLPCYDGQNFFDNAHPTYQDDGSTFSNVSAAGASQPWYLLDLSKMILPLIFQEREKPHFWMVTDPQDPEVRNTGYFGMYAEARGAAGFTFPYLAYRSTLPLNPANFTAARDAMRAYKDHIGDPLEVEPTDIVVGVSNFQTAEDLFKKANLAGGESNTLNMAVNIIRARRLP